MIKSNKYAEPAKEKVTALLEGNKHMNYDHYCDIREMSAIHDACLQIAEDLDIDTDSDTYSKSTLGKLENYAYGRKRELLNYSLDGRTKDAQTYDYLQHQAQIDTNCFLSDVLG